MRRSLLVLVLGFTALGGGCEKEPPPSTRVGQATHGGPAPASSVAPERAPEPTVFPDDLDVPALEKKLGCPRAGRKACRIIKEFAVAEPWAYAKLEREARWIGNAFEVEKKSEEKQAWVLWAGPVPTAQVDPGLLPLRVAAGVLSEGLGHERWKVINAVSRLASVSKRNRALVAASRFAPTSQRPTQRTRGRSITWLTEDKAYVRQQGRKLLVIKLSSSPAAAPGQGTYAELWPVFW